MKNKLFIIALLMLSITSCNNNPKEDTQEVKELKQEVEDLKANVKELEGNDNSKDTQETEVVDKEEVPKEKPKEAESTEYSGLEEIKDDLEQKKPSSLSDILMENIEYETNNAVSGVTFEESVKLIENNPEIFLDDNAADSLINMFNHVYWDELNLDASTPKSITKIEGEFLREFDASYDSDQFNVFKIGFHPNPERDDAHFFTVYYCGDIRNYLFPYRNGEKYMKIWALPVGAYQLKDEEGETLTTYVYVSSETFQNVAYNYFGEWWRN